MNDAEKFFKNVGSKIETIAMGPSKLLNSITNALDNPLFLYGALGIGAIIAFNMVKVR
jgi:hypothetical protein